ncbi:DUF3341 domain-containing protein [Marinithermus hydrothermalis]|uniref:Quinol:cytochrome c oxidoreductase membrane protein n=1 Tax=Marinithermus hydrothermalis (strain DSM 14884 / JCM 11576 / T1) TaxID=869210 RepID=F2NR63_MARHT|nr:DUF3341 domain-containing protein [Marinithermus hydrothermalis]AEB12912.1 hypothetical protein Marky_2191 [Marinithermus hydrothermalis DSM 14884]
MARLFGLVAEFDDPERLLEATRRARAEGYQRLDAHTPFPVEGLVEALGRRDERIPWIAFVVGMLGAAFGFWMQAYIQTVDYPLNIGGKPLLGWPAYVPITFEITILSISIALFFAMLLMNGLPLAHHPLRNTPVYPRIFADRFVLVVEATDPRFDPEATRTFLEGLGALSVTEVREA